MKIIPLHPRRLTLLALGLLAFASACKKSNDNTGNNNNPTTYVKATIDGTNWQAGYIYAKDSANIIAVLGAPSSANGYPLLAVAFSDSIPSGTTLNFDINNKTLLEYAPDSTSLYFAEPLLGGSGTLTITSIDKTARKVSGNFSGTVKNFNGNGASKSITNGQFAATYQ